MVAIHHDRNSSSIGVVVITIRRVSFRAER